MSEVAICSVTDVPEDSVHRFDIGDRAIAVYNIAGQFYATDDECTHGAASLSQGILDGDVIECTLHFGAFNVKTGAVEAAPCSIRLRTYKVDVRDEKVWVDLEQEAAG